MYQELRRSFLTHFNDGIKQITKTLEQYPHLSSLHIVAHGKPGCLYLGKSQLSLDTLESYTQDLKTWFSKSLFLYGCQVAAGDAGAEFITKLAWFKLGLQKKWHWRFKLKKCNTRDPGSTAGGQHSPGYLPIPPRKLVRGKLPRTFLLSSAGKW